MLYTENLYIIIWALLFLGWLGGMFLAYTKSSRANRTRNVLTIGIAGAILAFIATATNPTRDLSSGETNPMNFKIPENREIPERITVEPQLTDEKRAESLESERESSKLFREREFGEDQAESEEEEKAEETKGE